MREYSIKPRIQFGHDSLENLKNLNYKTYFIVTDKSMVELKIIDELLKNLPKNSKIEIFDGVIPNPTVEIIEEGLKKIMQFDPECVISIGGGSPIDACKGIIYFSLKINKEISRSNKKPYFIAIPTTSGTGSEVTSYSVITKDDKKIALSDEEMLPDLALLSPDFMKTLPSKIIADTGMDVLTHALEAFVSKIATPFTDATAKEAIKIIKENLAQHFENPQLLLQRERVQYASCMAGIAFNNSSLGINHSIAHSIGAKFHIPHGRANAIVLPYVVEVNKNAWSKYEELSKILGFESNDSETGKNRLNDFIKKLRKDLKIENSLQELGIELENFKEKIPEILKDIKQDICTKNSPNELTDEEYIILLLKIYFGI